MKQSAVNAAGDAFCAPHFSTRLDFIPKGSLVFSLGRRISVALDEDGTSSFISSLHLRPAVPLRISWTAIEPRSPLVLRAEPHSLPLPLSLSQVALCCVFCLPLPLLRASRVSCPSLSSVSVLAGDFFRPRHLARSSGASLFLLSHSRFRSVGLWGRKNERTNERASERTVGWTDERMDGRTDGRNWRGALTLSPLSSSSFSRSRAVGRRSFVRWFARSLAQSLGHPLRLPRSSPVLYIY